MPNATSLSFPNMFNIVQNRVGVLHDSEAVTSRTKLLLSASPKSMYNSPDFGVGLPENMFQYMTKNNQAALKDKVISKIEQYEPTAVAGAVDVIFDKRVEGQSEEVPDHLEMIVKIGTVFGDVLEVEDNVN